MRADNLEFPEALRRLAQRAGVALSSGGRRGEQQSLYQVNEAARRVFQQRLASSQGAATRAYLVQRGFTPEAIERFELGLSPADGQGLRQQLVQEGFSLEQLVLAGLVRQVADPAPAGGGQAHHRDLFRGRLIIPIRNTRGDLAGFGGRAMEADGPGSQPKYLNSPRSPVFDKGRILYALDKAKESVRQEGMVIVEGYMDAIMAHQHGFTNVVASMGTALTEHQVEETRRLTSQVVLALDPDAAGQQATLRGLETSWKVFQAKAAAGRAGATTVFQRVDAPELKIAVMPGGLDPDEVIRRAPEEWRTLVAQGTPLLDYLFDALSAHLDISTPQGKARLAELLFPLIAAAPQATQQDYYFQMLAARMGISEETLRASVGRPSPYPTRVGRGAAQTGPRQATASAFARLDRDPVEDYCLALLLRHPELREAAGELRQEYFTRAENREILNHLVLSQAQDRALPAGGDAPALVLAALQGRIDPELAEHLEALLHKSLPPMDPQRRLASLEEAVRRLEDRYLRGLKTEESLKFGDPATGGLDSLEDYRQEVLHLNQRIKLNQSRPRQAGGLETNLSPRG
jgi:DNA primase